MANQQTRWLSESEQRVWRTYLAVTKRVWDRLDAELQEAADLSMNDYDVLVRLSEAPDRCLRMLALAERVMQSKSGISHTVQRLERRGLVRRERCPRDLRGRVCHITAAGLHKLHEAAPAHVQSVHDTLFAPLSDDDVAHLATCLDKLAANDRLICEADDLGCNPDDESCTPATGRADS